MYAFLDEAVCQAVFLGDGDGVGEPVRGLAHDLVRPLRWIAGLDRTDHAHHLFAHRRQFVDEGHPDAAQAQGHELAGDSSAQRKSIAECGGGEDFVDDDDAVPRCGLEDGMNADKIILELPSQGSEVLLAFKMRENGVKEVEFRLPPWDRETQAGKVVQLPNSSREGGFPALVRSGDDQHLLLIHELKIIAYRSCVFTYQFVRQREIKRLKAIRLIF